MVVIIPIIFVLTSTQPLQPALFLPQGATVVVAGGAAEGALSAVAGASEAGEAAAAAGFRAGEAVATEGALDPERWTAGDFSFTHTTKNHTATNAIAAASQCLNV